MKFTGTNILYTPRVPQVNYLFKDVVVNSTGQYSFKVIEHIPNVYTGNRTSFLFSLSGNKVLDTSGQFFATYNTGESFSISGWVDAISHTRYLALDEILTRSVDNAFSGLIGEIVIECPTTSSLTCDIKLFSQTVTTDVSFRDFNIYGRVSGLMTTNTPTYVKGGDIQFFQSYESLITGGELLAYLEDSGDNTILYYDNDTAFANNSFEFDYYYQTTDGEKVKNFRLSRTGLYNSGLFELVDLRVEPGFSGLFDGIWSGNSFVYQDEQNFLDFNYKVSAYDLAGHVFDKNLLYNVGIYGLNTSLPASYITGFTLTASGEYLSPPQIVSTGYYYVTGIQQALDTMLFSTGCTGNLAVNFATVNAYGTGASGELVLTAVNFSGVYSTGPARWMIPTAYITKNVGTGYTLPPLATINTGQYGTKCYDVPNTSGYTYAWFRRFHTSGSMDIEAGWFTGVALCTTGLVSGGLMTGYKVTGIDVYNIGTGYSSIRPPLVTFVRTGEVGLTLNASGIFSLKTGSQVNTAKFSISTGLAGLTLSSGKAPSGAYIYMRGNDDYVTIRIKCSGLDNTVPISGYVQTSVVGNSTLLTSYFTYSKYYDTGPYALKKKDNNLTVFAINSELSFGLTANQLDSLYSSAGYTNNTWTYEEGDFDF